MVVSTTGDPATPYQAGVDLAAALGGTLLRVEGDQHGAVLAGSRCVDDAVSAYLVDLTVPGERHRLPARTLTCSACGETRAANAPCPRQSTELARLRVRRNNP